MTDPTNINVVNGNLVITLTQVSDPTSTVLSTGGELKSVTPFGFGTYTYTFYEDVIESGSVADGFLYTKNPVTEIDCAEQQGQYANRADFSNYTSGTTKTSSFVNLNTDFTQKHTVNVVWSASRVTWYIDGAQVADHTDNIPTTDANFIFQLRGTNSVKWGGLATLNVTRHLIVTSFKFQGE